MCVSKIQPTISAQYNGSLNNVFIFSFYELNFSKFMNIKRYQESLLHLHFFSGLLKNARSNITC